MRYRVAFKLDARVSKGFHFGEKTNLEFMFSVRLTNRATLVGIIRGISGVYFRDAGGIHHAVERDSATGVHGRSGIYATFLRKKPRWGGEEMVSLP